MQPSEAKTVDKIFSAANALGIRIILGDEGLCFTRPEGKIDKNKYLAIKEFRMTMVRNRRSIIERLGGDPDKYQWTPSEGTDERVWYDHIKGCIEEKCSGTYVGQTGTSWHSKKDAERLLTNCRDSVEWRQEARRFWWDTTHAKSYREDDYEWPFME